MLIYCSRIDLLPKSPLAEPLAVTADWLSQKTRKNIQAAKLAGEGEESFPDRSLVEWLSVSHEKATWTAIRYAHPDRQVRGREWITEVGVYRDSKRFTCTVLLHTHESSALVDPTVVTTRPKLVADLFERCQVSSESAGGVPLPLTLNDAEAFLHDVRRPERRYPIVQLCANAEGEFLVDPNRLASQLAGVASVAVIPPEVDTYDLAESLSSRLCCYHGAVNIIWPLVRTASGLVAPNFRILSHQIEEAQARGESPENKLLGVICHRMNESLARDHVSLEAVRSIKHRHALEEARKTSPKGDSELEALARQVDVDQRARIERLEADLKSRDNDLASVRAALEESEAANASLKGSLEKATARQPVQTTPTLSPEVKTLLASAMGEDATLHDALTAISLLYSERLVILDSAWKSAKDAEAFEQPRKAFDLLQRLCTSYWDALSKGGSDLDARGIFGNAFSAGESETGEANSRAKNLRTFVYKGKEKVMMMHLKIGNKPSVAQTFRAYFEWDSKAKKIILGHCGKHLDLK